MTDLSSLGGLARPVATPEDAASIAAERWGLRGAVVELGSQQDRNFRIDATGGSVILKLANAATGRAELDAQHGALAEAAAAGLRVPAVVPSAAGEPVETVEL